MSNSLSIEPFNRLVRLTARAFYDDISMKGDNQPKTSRSDNRGMAVVILDALTRRQWVREEDLAKDLKLHLKQLRRTLRFFEEEKLVMRDHRKETAKGVRLHAAAVSATTDGQHHGREGEEKIKLHTHSYCCLDYAQIYDVVRYRMHRMKKKLKDELDSKNTIQEYICPNCNKRYTALDAARLISDDGENFLCENCKGELVAESDKFAAQEVGDADDNVRRRRREKLREMLQKLEEQLKPLVEQLNRVKDLPVPDFGTLQAWEVRASAAARAAAGDNPNDPSRSYQSGTPMPFLGDPKIDVAISGVEDKEDSKAGSGSTPMKVLPPWMIKQGMKLTKEQRGEVKEDTKTEITSDSSALSDDKKSTVTKDEKSFQDEYFKAYYAALLERQREEDAKRQQDLSNIDISDQHTSSDRQVGMKSKREDEIEDEDVWEEATPSGNPGESYKVADLNIQANDPAEEDNDDDDDDDDDDVEWEDG
ncbi:transcription initiation factor IIE subunit alpha-like isoform X2 [Amaranthus tricolor]|uniref:transcription initiation factor IIE subunit alpha-like isoform X2 n=1 Tax=Amaranthus tricolor TaxID=29722 RepID=UPI002585AC27|nr:transcription initiation factor IIE subunit alpha-like isoform X2 [Amaranthus tricolor]